MVGSTVVGVVYYELLKPNETVTADFFKHQLNKLNGKKDQQERVIDAKLFSFKITLWPHTDKIIKETLTQLEWQTLPHLTYSPDIVPSDYSSSHSVIHSTIV